MSRQSLHLVFVSLCFKSHPNFEETSEVRNLTDWFVNLFHMRLQNILFQIFLTGMKHIIFQTGDRRLLIIFLNIFALMINSQRASVLDQ